MESNCSCMGTRASPSPRACVDRGDEGGEGEGGGVCSMTEPMPVVDGDGDKNLMISFSQITMKDDHDVVINRIQIIILLNINDAVTYNDVLFLKCVYL